MRINRRNDEKIEQLKAQRGQPTFVGGRGALGGASSPPEDPSDIARHRARVFGQNERAAKMQSLEMIEQQR